MRAAPTIDGVTPWTREVGPRLGRGLRRGAGRAEDAALDARVGHVVLGAVAATLLLGVLVGPMAGLVLGLVGGGGSWCGSVMRQRRAAHQRATAVLDAVPDMIELLRLATLAGLTVRLAVEAVADLVPGPVVEPLALVVRRAQRGDRLADALGELGALGPPARPLLDALLATERYGVPLEPVLERLAVEARDQRRRRREEAARRVPVQMLFPLVCCTLPALVVLTVVPLLARAFASLAP